MSKKVFICWSGPTSQAVAVALREVLEPVLQRVDLWVSPHDIAKGSHWPTELRKNLNESTAGIICLTADNRLSPWLHFEAGALAKQVDEEVVIPYLFEIGPADLAPPLGQFQWVLADRDGTLSMVERLNEASERPLKANVLNDAFEPAWQKLQARLQALPAPAAVTPARDERELLEELLLLARRIEHRGFSGLSSEARSDLAKTVRETEADRRRQGRD